MPKIYDSVRIGVYVAFVTKARLCALPILLCLQWLALHKAVKSLCKSNRIQWRGALVHCIFNALAAKDDIGDY
jgi:hypothetical protein